MNNYITNKLSCHLSTTHSTYNVHKFKPCCVSLLASSCLLGGENLLFEEEEIGLDRRRKGVGGCSDLQF